VKHSILTAVLAALLAQCAPAMADWVTATVGAGEGPYAVAVSPVTNKVYVANSGSNNVTVIEGGTNDTLTVGTGDGPRAVSVNPVTNKVYVANIDSDNVTVIDGATNDTLTVGARDGGHAR
jgi:YVTN family beta-propeller protein